MKRLGFLLILAFVWAFANAQTVEMNYSFEQPVITEIQGYEQIQLRGCMQSALTGQPSLPWQSVSLMLPQGQEATSIEVRLSDFHEIEGSHLLFPYQPSRAYSDTKPHEFVKDESIYNSKATYPSKAEGHLSTQYMNGIGFAFSAFTPVQYEPATGKIKYATKATVTVRTRATRANLGDMAWLTPFNVSRAERLAQNPEMIHNYQGRDGVPGYDLLVVTKQQYVSSFDEYVTFYQARGLRTQVVSIEDVLSTMSGQDNPEKLRNYIIQEYQDNGIQMVNLAGDVPDIPYRSFYCHVTSGGGNQEDDLPADLYYAALDGTWNDNGNNRWGEIGEDDLLPEIGIGRMCFSNQEELNNMMHKTTSYQDSPVLGEFHKVIMGGEHLYDNPESNGSQYLELLIGTHDDNGYTTTGIPENYNFTRLYEEQGNWSGSLLMNAINQGTQYVHHDGHANTTYVAGWYNSDITDGNFSNTNGVDHNYTFFHTSGCICGDFTSTCILEKMTKISNFAVATIGNSRYGWFNEGQTEGPAIHLHRETEDAYYHDRIPQSGLALTEGKIQTAPWVNAPGQWEEGALRWNFYDLNLMGDVAVCPWHDEPFTPEVNYTAELLVGTSSTEVNVNDNNGNPLKNFRCAIFHGVNLIGVGYTGDNGTAQIEFAQPIDFVDELSLVVTGCDAWPQSFEAITLPGNTAYVIYNNYSLNGGLTQIDFGGSYAFDMDIKNVGTVNASDVTATLTTESEYVTITQSTANVGVINGGQSLTLENAFAFTVSDDVPNNTLVRFNLTCTNGTDTWESHFNTRIYAPDFKLVSATLETPTGSFLSPGDSGIVHFVFKNNGGAAAPSARFDIYNSHPEIDITTTQWTFENLAAGQEFTADMSFTLSDAASIGALYELPYAVQYGQYVMLESYYIPVGRSVEDFESGDFNAFDWHHGSIVTAWEVVTDNPYEGTYCAKSSYIDNNETSVLSISLDIAIEGEVSFYYKVSSESNWDWFSFKIDGMEQNKWSGEIGWTQASFPLTQGTHTLEWNYTKDGSFSSGSDCAWIDNVVFPAAQVIAKTNEVIANAPALYPNPNNGSFSIDLPEEDCNIAVYNSLGQLVYRQENASGLTNLHLEGMNNGMYFVTVQTANGTSTQKFVKK
jgi:hypothetical protein